MTDPGKALFLSDPERIRKILTDPAALAEALTGLIAADANRTLLTAGRVVQGFIRQKGLKQLADELEACRAAGKVDEKTWGNDKNQQALYEILEFIDSEAPDEERFKAMKTLFIKTVTTKDEQERALAYQLMLICRKLSSNVLAILRATELIDGDESFRKQHNEVHSADDWHEEVARRLGHGVPSLVAMEEENLAALKLISRGNRPSNRAGFYNHRLSDLGISLCKFLSAPAPQS